MPSVGGSTGSHGDFVAYPFEPESFDVVSIASLHHMEMSPALARMSRFLRPGGRLAAVGLARSRARDLPNDLAVTSPTAHPAASAKRRRVGGSRW